MIHTYSNNLRDTDTQEQMDARRKAQTVVMTLAFLQV